MLAATGDSQPGDVSATAYCLGQAGLATERSLPEGFLLLHRDTLCLCTSDHNLAGQERCLSYSRCQEIMGVGHHGLGQQQQEMAGGHTVQLPQNSADLDMLLLHPEQVGTAKDDCAFVHVRGEALLGAGCDGCKDSPSASSARQCSERESGCGAFLCPSEDEWHRNARTADERQMKATSFVLTQTLSSSTSCLSDTNLNAVPVAYQLRPPVTCQMDGGLSRSVLKAAALLTASSNEQRGNRGAEDVGTTSRIEEPDSHASSEIDNCMFPCVPPSRDATLFRQVNEPRDKNTQAQRRVCPPRLWNAKGQREATSTARVANCLEDCADGNRRWAAVAKTLMLIRSDSSTECSHSQVRDMNCPPTDFLHTEGKRFRCKNTVSELEHWADENNTRNFASQARLKRSYKDMQHLDGRQAPLFLHEAHRPICDSDTWNSQNVLLCCGHSVNSITFPAIVDLRSCDKPMNRRGDPSCFTSSSRSIYAQSGCQGQASWSSKGHLRPARCVLAQRRTRETRPGVLGPQRDPLEVRKRHLARLRCGNQSRLSLIKRSRFLRYRTVSLKSPSPKMRPRQRLASANSVQNISVSQTLADRQEAQRGNQRMSVPRMYEVRSIGMQTEDIMICPSNHTSGIYREEKPEGNNMSSSHVREDLDAMYSSLGVSSVQPYGNSPMLARWHRDVTSADTCEVCYCRRTVSNAVSAQPMASRSRSALRSAAYSSKNCLRQYSQPCNQRSFASRCQCARLHRLGRRSMGLKRGPGVSLRTICTVSAQAPFEHPERRQVSHRRSEVAHNRKACDFSSATQSQEEKLGLRAAKTCRPLSNRNGIKATMHNHSNNTVTPQEQRTKVRNEQLDGACKSSTTATAHYDHPPRTRAVLDDLSSQQPSVAISACSRDCSEAEPDFDNVPCSSRAGPCRSSSSLVEPITTATADDDNDDDDDETPSREASVRLANAGYTPGPQETRRNNTTRVCSHVYAHTGASGASVPKHMKASQRSLLTSRREYVGPFSGYGSTFPTDTASMSTAWTQSPPDLPPRCAIHTIGDAADAAADGSNDDRPRQGNSWDTSCIQESSFKSKRNKHRKARLYHKARQLLRQMCHVKGKEEILFRAAIRLQRKRLEIQELHSSMLVAAKHLQAQSGSEDQRSMSSKLWRRAQKLVADQMISHDVCQRRDSRKGHAHRSRSTRHHPRHYAHQSAQPDSYTFCEHVTTGETNGQQCKVSWGEPHQQQPPQPQQVGGRGGSSTSSASGSTATGCKVGMHTESSVQKDDKTISFEDSDDDDDDDESYSSGTRSEDEENNRDEKPSTSRKQRSDADTISESSDDDSEDPTKCGFFREQ